MTIPVPDRACSGAVAPLLIPHSPGPPRPIFGECTGRRRNAKAPGRHEGDRGLALRSGWAGRGAAAGAENGGLCSAAVRGCQDWAQARRDARSAM